MLQTPMNRACRNRLPDFLILLQEHILWIKIFLTLFSKRETIDCIGVNNILQVLEKNECRQITISSRTWGRYIRFMFMEDEQAATFYATVTFRRTLLVDNHPHFIFLRNRTKPVFLIMIWFIEQQKSVERDIYYQSFFIANLSLL